MDRDQEIEKINYEISCLVREEKALEEVARLLLQHDAEILSQGPAKKISLAYQIGKETQAFFSFVYFKSHPESVKLLETDLTRSNAVLRFLLIRVPANKSAYAESERRKQKPLPAHEAKEEAKTGSGPLSNEALEKKIEEILK